jgi:hypothetical protein
VTFYFKEELLDLTEGGDRVFIDKRPWSPAECDRLACSLLCVSR